MNDMFCDHLCIICWVKDRPKAFRHWFFLRLPTRYRHRVVMREAMKMRRAWLELKREGSALALVCDPRGAHSIRRLQRSLLRQTEVFAFPSAKIEWREESE